MKALIRRVGGRARRILLSKLDLESNLNQWRSLDQIRQEEIDALDRLFAASRDQAADIDRILAFFTKWPEKCELVSGSDYYLARNPDNLPLRIAAVAGAYALGDLQRANAIADELVRLSDRDTFRALKARIVGQLSGAAAELDAVRVGRSKCPDSYMLKLYEIDLHAQMGNIIEANSKIDGISEDIRVNLGPQIESAAANQRDLEKAIAEKRMSIPDGLDIYDDEFCRTMWDGYYESFRTRTLYQHGDATVMDNFYRIFSSIAKDVDLLIDFGSMCADPTYRMALKFPNIHFLCQDRQRLIADLNKAAYTLPNLEFRAGDILDSIASVANINKRKALVHIRTACICYPAFMQKLYAECRKAGIDYILMIENCDMSLVDLRFRDFKAMNEVAVVTKHKLYLHNYARLFDEAGYDIAQVDRIARTALWSGRQTDAYLSSQYVAIARLRS